MGALLAPNPVVGLTLDYALAFGGIAFCLIAAWLVMLLLAKKTHDWARFVQLAQTSAPEEYVRPTRDIYEERDDTHKT